LQATNTQLSQERDNLQAQITQRDNRINALNGTVAQLTKDKQALGTQLAQARNQAVRDGAAQPAVNQNQAIPAAKPIPQQTARPAAQTTGTAIA
jgi:peptidoglycan hydrolase CwlO-like protein